MTKGKGSGKGLNNKDIRIDRGLELMLESKREIVKPQEKVFEFKFKLFEFEMHFEIKKLSQGANPCKQH
jgi:hypothetical protein|tara:strand:+ start:2454 stop:2660 length:207 start_codon:yes stop_codon:yes gene_type:complete